MRTIADTPWLLMWLIAVAIFFSCKALTWQFAAGQVAAELASWARWGYWFAWPGLDANRFLRHRPADARPSPTEWLFAAAKTFFGALLFSFGGLAVPDERELLRGWIGMIGVVFVLHFGLFHALSCFWRTLGHDAPPLMDHPWAATSVADFWGRRWNRAFRDFTHRFLFRPLARTTSPQMGMVLGFLISGLLHEAVITVPARGSYGGPTLYFCIQALGISIEHSQLGRRLLLGENWRGRLFALVVVLAPVGFLFPPAFIRNVVLPMMHAFGAY